MEGEAQALLDFERPVDVALYSRVADIAMGVAPGDRAAADRLLGAIAAHPAAWTRVDRVLSSDAASTNAKFHALQVLDELVRTRWKTLPREQCDGLKNYVVSYIIARSSDGEALRRHRLLLHKLNKVLVEIIKQDWPRHWQSFMPEIVSASKTNEALAANNMHILMLLSEEVFDFSRGNLTQAKVRQLKQQFHSEFAGIFELCQFILAHSTQQALVHSTLETLLRFLNWIPLGYVFETDLIEQLLTKFLPVPSLCSVTTKCLTEIAGLDATDEVGEDKFRELYVAFMQVVSKQLLPESTDIAAAYYECNNDNEQKFIEDLAMFLATFFREHRRVLEKPDSLELLADGHMYLSRIGLVDDTEIFKICLEYWHHLAETLYHSRRYPRTSASSPLMLHGARASGASEVPEPYAQILSTVRAIMIQRMAKPEEVLVVKDPDTGEIVRESVPDTDSRTLYKQMRETLVFLTHLDATDTHMQMSSKLSRQVNGSEWSHDKLNTLCWAIGSISGACSDESEKKFLVTVIKDLLGLCEMKRGKDHKAVVAANIMYVVGQYPAFLRQHWKFLKTVINKLFEFMHETHPGVQDMAVDTFLKIARTCKRKFVVQQPGEAVPFISVILDKLADVVRDLESEQIEVFYEACGVLIASHTNKDTREALIGTLMQRPNETWQQLMAAAGKDVQALCAPDALATLISILKLNYRATLALGFAVTAQLGGVYLDLLNVYKFYCQCVSETLATGNKHAGEVLVARRQRAAKQWVLRLLAAYVERCTDRGLLRTSFLPPLLDAVLGNYGDMVPESRDAWVLTLMTTIVDKLEDEAQGEVGAILGRIFEPTLAMITDDFTNYPTVRLEFFKLLSSINKHCFASLFALPPDSLKLVIDALVYGARHTDRSISETALGGILELVVSVTAKQRAHEADVGESANEFWQRFLVSLVQDMLAVLTDTMHKSGFKMQAALLRALIANVETGLVTAPILPPPVAAQIGVDESRAQEASEPNPQFLRRFIAQTFSMSFEQLTPNQITDIVNGLFALHNDLSAFKNHLRDFLVQLREYMTQDNEDLYVEEREAEAEAKEKAERERAEAIPGLVPLHDLDDMAD